MFAERVTTSGHRKLRHWSMKASTARAATAGLASGSVTRQKSVHSPAPSRRAASSTSTGSMRKVWRMSRMPRDVGEAARPDGGGRSGEDTAELQSPHPLVCRLLLEKK